MRRADYDTETIDKSRRAVNIKRVVLTGAQGACATGTVGVGFARIMFAPIIGANPKPQPRADGDGRLLPA